MTLPDGMTEAEQLESAVLAAEKSKAASNDDTEPSPKISPSQIVYDECMKDVQIEYAAWCAGKKQYDAEMTAVAQCSDSLHLDSSDKSECLARQTQPTWASPSDVNDQNR